ncbi:hypothetical protein Poly41_47310 [Novipirellula artificiosorum]|uniref:Uncharacterized protein n=1 Tax=Novipirellula artificiosorum TaxID=2528016 RepID=A0A5C6DBZ9_9BACT|nr:hypothetical protein Poly41_47310 [Novipirellula artificiosorum]
MIVCLATLVAGAGSASAGIMTSPLEVDSFANVDASRLPITNPEEDPELVRALQQTFGMSRQSSAGVDNTPPVFVGILDYPSVQDEFCQWLVSYCNLLIPSPIPICLLKVPIEVV